MTEKFDGVRLFWDGSAFYNRQGGKLRVPNFFKEQMPNVALDGELW
jgi:DNA ligase-1